MAVTTLNAHIGMALQLQKRADTAYLVLGKTSEWDNEENPPNEDEDVDSIDEVIGYRKLSQFSLARPLESDEDEDDLDYPVIAYKDNKWVMIPRDKAYEEKARWVYIEAEIDPDDFELGKYRQVGVHIDLEPKSGITKLNLEPDDVKDTGVLQFYENREPQNRTESVYVLEQFMIEV